MKKIKIILSLLLLLSGTKIIRAGGHLSAVLVTSSGIITEKKISLNQLHSINGLNILDKEGTQTKKIPDIYYQITMIERGKKEQVFEVQTEIFNDNIKRAFQNINGKVKIYFEFINAVMPDKTMRKLPPIAIEVQ